MKSEQLHQVLDERGTDSGKRRLIDAALGGDDSLARVLEGEEVTTDSSVVGDTSDPAVFLSSVSVEGFRGIGPKSTLLLTPGPGLSLVVGRNGSGKSSFAEGLEFLLTGKNLRWEDRNVDWRAGWRNLHHDEPAEIEASFTVERRDLPVTVSRAWRPDSDLAESEVSLTDPAGTWDGLGSTGWESALDRHRPFLSYNELGSMFEERRSDLHDAMSAFLGLEELLQAQEVLRQARLANERPAKDVKAKAKVLQAELEAEDDQRAAEAALILSSRKPDLARLGALAASDTDVDVELSRIRAIANLVTPDAVALREAADRLAHAITRALNQAQGNAGQAERLAQLLTLAADHAHDTGSSDCPVCGTGGVLSDEWRRQNMAAVAELRANAASMTEAMNELEAARRAGRTAVVAPPPHLVSPDATPRQRAAADAWQRWADTPPTDQELADRLRSFDSVEGLVEDARREAATIIEERDLRWRPLARQLGTWLDERTQADVSAQRATELKEAETELKAAISTIRSERFAPISAQARDLWSVLRHRSNVQLEAVELEGANTRRRVDLNVTVDGVESAALGVMSQGELHALALSLFLPRATMDASPFRFVIIDDPVQAMDPSRVDGLARVLERVAQTHQVVVFTHDDRLPEAVRRLQIPAEVTEVTRQPGSRVSTRPADNPVRTAISDAFAVAKTSQMHPQAKARIVPTYCRMAIEAAAATTVKRRLLAAGRPLANVEAELRAEHAGLRRLMALAIFGDADRTGDVSDTLRDQCDRGAAWALAACNAGAHGDFDGDPVALARTSEKVANWVLKLP